MPRVVVAILVAMLVVGCGTRREDPDPGPKVVAPPGLKPARELGPSEGSLRLLAPAEYVPAAARRGYGCDVTVTPAGTADDVVRQMGTGRFDGALGNGDATLRLIASGSIAPVNTALVPNYEDVYEGLKQRPFNSVGGQMFALPVGRATRVMVWRRAAIPGTITSLGAILDRPQAAAYGEHVTVPDDPASIAEAARWVGRQRRELDITDPYELDRRQFRGVISVLRQMHPYVVGYWHDPGTVRELFRSGQATIGIASQQVGGELHDRPGDGGPIDFVKPREGATGISPSWMIAAKAKHPNCLYRFLDRVLDPAINGQTAVNASIAPASSKACDALEERGNERHCALYHADDDSYYARTLYRTTPSSDCGDGRGRVCMDYETWVRAWDKVVRGS